MTSPTRMTCHRCGTPVPDGQPYCGRCGSQLSDPGAPPIGGDSASTPLLAELRAQLAGDYVIERELGRGGMGVVYLATEIALHRPVALKVLPPEMAHVTAIAERFKREARLAASLDHPNIIPILRVGQAGRTLFIAMKYVEGCPLDTILERRGALPLGVTLLVLRGAAGALAFAHEHDVIHRDIKGGNILLDRGGRVVVTDFGIARAAEDVGLTASGSVVGTPHYMSPEQCSGQPLGPQCDQYALGVVAFQMLEGRLPFDADSLPGIMHHHFFTPVPEVGARRPEIPTELRAIVKRAMAKRPAERFATTGEMVTALAAVPLGDAERRTAELALRELAATRGVAGVLPSVGATVGAKLHRQEARVPGMTAKVPGSSSGAQVLGRTRRTRWLVAAFVLSVSLVLGAGAAVRARGGWSGELRRGVQYYEAGQLEAAALVFENVARLQPQLAQPHVYLGRLARDRGDLPVARRELETALRLDHQNAMAAREMGALMLASGRHELARRFYMRAVRLDPTDRNARGFLGCTLIRLGEKREGAKQLEEAGDGPWRLCASASSRR